MEEIKLMATLWPTFPHFEEFANDSRLIGVRLNSATVKIEDIGDQLQKAKDLNCKLPLYFDIKGNQLRVLEDHSDKDHLEIEINHPTKETLNISNRFNPYSRDDKLVRPWVIPGTKGLEYQIGGLEKEENTETVEEAPEGTVTLKEAMEEAEEECIPQVLKIRFPQELLLSGISKFATR